MGEIGKKVRLVLQCDWPFSDLVVFDFSARIGRARLDRSTLA